MTSSFSFRNPLSCQRNIKMKSVMHNKRAGHLRTDSQPSSRLSYPRYQPQPLLTLNILVPRAGQMPSLGTTRSKRVSAYREALSPFPGSLDFLLCRKVGGCKDTVVPVVLEMSCLVRQEASCAYCFHRDVIPSIWSFGVGGDGPYDPLGPTRSGSH